MASKRLKARDIRGKPRGRIVDLTGQRFGKLVVVRLYGMRAGKSYWHCHCDCGRSSRVRMNNLRQGRTRSCGCGLRGDGLRQSQTSEYAVWLRRVRDDSTFRDFAEFMGQVGARPTKRHRLYRLKANSPFGPGNCQWSLARNAMGKAIEHAGLRLTVPQWAKRLRISKQALYQRLARHDLQTALSTKKMKRGPKKHHS